MRWAALGARLSVSVSVCVRVQAYQGHLVSREDTKELVDLGRSDVAIDVLAKKGEWERVWEVAAKEKMPAAQLGKYILMRVEELLRDGGGGGGGPKGANSNNGNVQLDEAVRVLQRRGTVATEQAVEVYRKLVVRILSRTNDEEHSEHTATVHRSSTTSTYLPTLSGADLT